MADNLKLTDEEATVWHAAYGAAFATKFEDWVATEGFEYASQAMTAERAVAVADAAVLRLREWHEATRRPTEAATTRLADANALLARWCRFNPSDPNDQQLFADTRAHLAAQPATAPDL